MSQTVRVAASDYLAPVLALFVVALLTLLSRWVFAPNIRKHKTDFGLLIPVVTITDEAQALGVRNRLVDAGLRSTLGKSHAITRVTHDGFAFPQPPGFHVLVFPQDYERAKTVLSDGAVAG